MNIIRHDIGLQAPNEHGSSSRAHQPVSGASRGGDVDKRENGPPKMMSTLPYKTPVSRPLVIGGPVAAVYEGVRATAANHGRVSERPAVGRARSNGARANASKLGCGFRVSTICRDPYEFRPKMSAEPFNSFFCASVNVGSWSPMIARIDAG